MKYCGYCGNPIPDDMIFCPKCGKKQVKSDAVVNEDNQEKPNHKTPTKSKRILPIVIGSIAAAVLIVGLVVIFPYLNPSKQNAEVVSTTSVPTVELAQVSTEQSTPVPTEQPTPEPTEEPFTIVGNTEAIEKISRSVVKLTCYDEIGNEYASGSGFFAFENNLIVTNYHVIAGNVYSIVASSDGKNFAVDYLVNYNERYDLALLRVKESEMSRQKIDFEPLVIGDSSEAKVSEHITAIGVPLGVSKTVSDGMISGFYEDNGVKLIQFTAPISHGSSGGALLNDKGEVIGITSASFSDGQNFNLTVPSSYISILYNADSKEQKITTFHNQYDHYYSVDYCLANHDKFSTGKTITVHGYVSSYERLSEDYVSCFIVSNPENIDGTYYIDGVSPKLSQSETQRVNEHMKRERDLAWNFVNIEVVVFGSAYDSILKPGNYVLVKGSLLQMSGYKDYPGKSMLGIFPTKVELAH